MVWGENAQIATGAEFLSSREILIYRAAVTIRLGVNRAGIGGGGGR